MTRGKPYAEEVTRVANESVCVFPLLETCDALKDSKSNRKCLTWFRYPYILTSLASSSPFTWPTTNLEFKNTSTAFPPIFCTMAIPCNEVSYSASLFVAKNPSLRDFSVVILLGDIRTSPTRTLFGLLRHQHTSSNVRALARRLCQPIFHPCITP